MKYRNPDEMINALHDHFMLGAHKATAIAMLKKRADILFVSDMDSSIIQKTFLQPVDDLHTAFDACMKKYGADAKVIVMPYGGSTLPVME